MTERARPRRNAPLAWTLVAAALAPACAVTTEPPRAPVAGVSARRLDATPPAAAPAGPPRFIENDWNAAIADAKAHARPVFVDAWAPWCHTCASLRAFVLRDPALAPLAERFTWLALDTERPEGDAFLAKHPMRAWPTLWVIDAETDAALLAWPGSLRTPELIALLDETERAWRARGSDTPAAARAERAVAERAGAAAIAALESALAASTRGTPEHARLADALVSELAASGRVEACVEVARREVDAMPRGTAQADLVAVSAGCAGEARSEAARRARAELTERLATIARDASYPLLADDRSSLYEQLVTGAREGGRAEEAKQLAAAWSAFLDGEAARAPDASARAVFDAHRLLAYIELGQAERALPMLAASERDFPDDYNPPARLARALLVLGRTEEALAKADAALARVYGPRRLRVAQTKADVLAARKDRAAEAAALRDALASPDAASARGGYVKLVETLRERLAKLEAK